MSTPKPMFQLKPPTEKERLASLGTPALILACLDLAQDAMNIGSSFVVGSLIGFEKKLLHMTGAASPLGVNEMLDGAARFASRIGQWNALRMIPFALASVFLIPIALRLRKGDRSALVSAKRWTSGAFVVLAISLAIQLLVALPMQTEYQQLLFAQMRLQESASRAPDILATVNGITRTFTSASVWIGLLGGFMAMATWPIIVRFQATRWLREPGTSPTN